MYLLVYVVPSNRLDTGQEGTIKASPNSEAALSSDHKVLMKNTHCKFI